MPAIVIRPNRVHSVHKMRPTSTDGVAWSVCVSVSVLVMFMSPATTAETIEMPFVWLVLTRVGPSNHVLDEDQERINPSAFNPLGIRQSPSIGSFKRHIKTHLFTLPG